MIYDYTLNKNISLGVSPTYRFNYTNLAWLETSGLGEERQYSHCLDIPIYADYKWRITDNNKLFAGLGVSGMFDLGSDEFTMKRDLFTSYAVFRLGFEVEIKYRLQFLMQYRWNMNKSVYEIVSGRETIISPRSLQHRKILNMSISAGRLVLAVILLRLILNKEESLTS